MHPARSVTVTGTAAPIDNWQAGATPRFPTHDADGHAWDLMGLDGRQREIKE